MTRNDSTTRGRRERPVPPGPLHSFAQGLRELRAAAGNPSYRAMERKAGYSASALSAAAAGDRLPSLAVTRAYVGACGGDQDEWERNWHAIGTELDKAYDTLAFPPVARIHRPPTRPPRRPIRPWMIVLAVGLIGLVTVTAFREEPPTGETPAGGAAPTTDPQSSPIATAAAFTAVAGPGCPREAGRSVRISGVPGQDGWKDAKAPGWTGAGCGDSFLFSQLTHDPKAAKHPENSFQWWFTTGLRGQHQCFVAVYVPKSGLAGQRVWYTVKDGFDEFARTVGEFTLDQSMQQGRWVPAPAAITITSGLVMMEIKDTGKGNTTGDQSMAAGPVRLTCL